MKVRRFIRFLRKSAIQIAWPFWLRDHNLTWSDYLQDIVRRRPVRLALALTLIAAAGWISLPYAVYRVASSAFVNAELVRVAAPISGRLTRNLPTKGVFIEKTASIPLIEALSPDRRHLLDLERQYAV